MTDSPYPFEDSSKVRIQEAPETGIQTFDFMVAEALWSKDTTESSIAERPGIWRGTWSPAALGLSSGNHGRRWPWASHGRRMGCWRTKVRGEEKEVRTGV